MDQLLPIIAIVVSILAGALAAACLLRVLTLPQVPRLHAAVSELLETVSSTEIKLGSLDRKIDTIESDVQHRLDQATIRMRRANARESSEKRVSNQLLEDGQQPQRAPSIDEQYAAASAQMWDQTGAKQ